MLTFKGPVRVVLDIAPDGSSQGQMADQPSAAVANVALDATSFMDERRCLDHLGMDAHHPRFALLLASFESRSWGAGSPVGPGRPSAAAPAGTASVAPASRRPGSLPSWRTRCRCTPAVPRQRADRRNAESFLPARGHVLQAQRGLLVPDSFVLLPMA
jgi:hypothetical protein